MYVGYAIIGLIVGGVVGGWSNEVLLGAIGGAVFGIVLARITRLEKRVWKLETAAREPRHEPVAAPEPASAAAATEAPSGWPESHRPGAGPPESADDAPAPEVGGEGRRPAPAKSPMPRGNLPAARPVAPPYLQSLLKKASAWLTSGNVPVKVGVLISFIGVSFLLKYAIDRKLFFVPVEFRLLAVAAAGLALIVIGWRLRKKARVYALSLQGGGAGILFLTIFAALRLWQLLPAPLAFFLLVALTVFTGALAVMQNARSLAVLGVVGGFLAPVLASTGQGSHVILFSYYLVLNGAIIGIAWFRAWRELNLVGFVFTFVIGSFWGYRYYKPALFSSTEPFVLLHFLFYQAIAILYALRQPRERIGVVDGTLVFGTPVIVFALQAALLRDSEYGLAISAAAVAVFYALIATWLFRSKGRYLQLLTESFMALAVAFATIAIPLALDARWTAAAWALEGAALVWVGARQGRHLAKLAGAVLIVFSGLSFSAYGWRHGAGPLILNGNVLGGVLISLSAFFASRRLESAQEHGFEAAHRVTAIGLFVWAALWWLGTGWLESVDRAAVHNQLNVFLLFLALSMGAAAWLGRARDWLMMHWSTLIFLPLLALLALEYPARQDHYLFALGWLAWPVAWNIQALALRLMDERDDFLAPAWHFASLLLLAVVLSVEAAWWLKMHVSGTWGEAVASAVPGVLALLIWRYRDQPDWPVPEHPTTYLAGSIVLVAGQALYLAWRGVVGPGNPDPLPYIPLANPFDLAMLFAVLTAWLSLGAIRREATLPGLARDRPFSGLDPWLPFASGRRILPYHNLRAGAGGASLHRSSLGPGRPVRVGDRADFFVDLLGPAWFCRHDLGHTQRAPHIVAGGSRLHGTGGHQAVPGRPGQQRHRGAHHLLHRHRRLAAGGRLPCTGAAPADARDGRH
jgi:uncharacterized membrane protein